MKRKWNKVPSPWTITEKLFAVGMASFFLFALVHSVLKFFGVI